MTKKKKLLLKIIQGNANVSFKDFILLVQSFGFVLSRVGGSHHIFAHLDVKQILNIQNVGGKAKPYQIRQFLKIVEENNLQFRERKNEKLSH